MIKKVTDVITNIKEENKKYLEQVNKYKTSINNILITIEVEEIKKILFDYLYEIYFYINIIEKELEIVVNLKHNDKKLKEIFEEKHKNIMIIMMNVRTTLYNYTNLLYDKNYKDLKKEYKNKICKIYSKINSIFNFIYEYLYILSNDIEILQSYTKD